MGERNSSEEFAAAKRHDWRSSWWLVVLCFALVLLAVLWQVAR